MPAHLREALPLDPAPALDVRDKRIKAAFAMAPGIIKAFGMDEAGLGQMSIPAYITVGARDTQTPPHDNAAFAAKHIPGATLVIIPGLVDHEIFVNECDDEGRDEFPEACIDAPGVDRAAIHQDVGAAALEFFVQACNGEGGDMRRLAAQSSACLSGFRSSSAAPISSPPAFVLVVTRPAFDDRGRAFKALVAGHAAAARHHLRPAGRLHRRASVERFREGQAGRRH